MTQFPVNLNNATNGHKLQSMTKDIIIVTSWPKGGGISQLGIHRFIQSMQSTGIVLYLFEPIDVNKSFEPSDELKSYFKRVQTAEKKFLKRRQTNINKFYNK